ncbi:MAG: WXG100 family type VII secretion target [Clostridiales bacterium]|nr:WXG100 family type VII secretion target [Clostridiales bacterium]
MSTKSAQTIQIEFQQVMRQVSTLKECVSDLNAQAKRMESLTGSLGSSWQGESAELYISKCKELQSKISSTAKNLSLTAEVISRMARTYRSAELKALETATLRTSG